MLGGAIATDKVKFQDIEPRREVDGFTRLLQNRSAQEFDMIHLQPVADALVDFRPRNILSFNQYVNWYHKYPQDKLLSGVEKMYSGHGSSKDHPKLHQLFMDSFSQYPELIDLYVNR